MQTRISIPNKPIPRGSAHPNTHFKRVLLARALNASSRRHRDNDEVLGDNDDRIIATVTPHKLAIINAIHVIHAVSCWAIHIL